MAAPGAQPAGQQALGDAKRKANVVAHGALAGYEVVQLADGTWLVSKWGLMSRPLRDIEAVEDFLARAAGRPT